MSGRWPANVILSPAMSEILDQQSGNRPGQHSQKDHVHQRGGSAGDWGSIGKTKPGQREGYNDEGGASRFFLQAGYEPWELEWILANGLTPCGAW